MVTCMRVADRAIRQAELKTRNPEMDIPTLAGASVGMSISSEVPITIVSRGHEMNSAFGPAGDCDCRLTRQVTVFYYGRKANAIHRY